MGTQVTESPAHPKSKLGSTSRKDKWWLGPLLTVLGLSLAGIYLNYRVFTAFSNHTHVVEYGGFGEMLSPLYAPLIPLSWLPFSVPHWFSPAFLILWAPGGFRVTCYYYRKAYYRSFMADPLACSVGELQGHRYRGETRLFIFQNLHRYFMYLALLFIPILALDVIRTCIDSDGFRLSVGTFVLGINATMLTLYTFSCHSLRHMVGGKIDCFSCVAFGDARHKLWKGASKLNNHHMLYAWVSLGTVCFADFYVWMVASKTITDFRIL